MIPVAPRRHAFTLVELIAALTLTTLLLGTLMGTTVALSKRTDTLTNEKTTAIWRTHLNRQLQSDFENCRSIIINARQVVMNGYMIPDDGSGTAGHVPCQVEYSFVDDGAETWLVRKSTRLDRTNDRETKRLLGKGFVAFRTDDRLDTDVAPGVLSLRLIPVEGEIELRTQLVRFGGATR